MWLTYVCIGVFLLLVCVSAFMSGARSSREKLDEGEEFTSDLDRRIEGNPRGEVTIHAVLPKNTPSPAVPYDPDYEKEVAEMWRKKQNDELHRQGLSQDDVLKKINDQLKGQV